MSDAKVYRRIARLSEEFPGLLAALKPGLKGMVPDDTNFTEESYDELFAILAAALYYVKDAKLRKASANASGGNPKLVAVLMDEGEKDKDAALVERILDRLAPYVPARVFLQTLAAMHANDAPAFREYHGALQRITADLYRIAAGFAPGEHCPVALVRWASGPNRELIRAELFA
ncbi:MAG: hypothetical protein QJR02_13975 [Sinobacteraceae bacterium]|nr:hypothetical protein [Nevskiaceae bacterium]